MHGLGLATERFYRKIRGLERLDSPPVEGNAPLLSLSAWARRILVFHIVCLAWILFRAQSITEAVRLLGGLGRWTWRPEFLTALTFLAVFSIPLFVLDLLLEWRSEEYVFEMTGAPLRIGWAMALVAVVVFFSANQLNAFIYFRF